MDLSIISLEIQQVFLLSYSNLIFWLLVFVVVGSISTGIINLVNNYRRRPR